MENEWEEKDAVFLSCWAVDTVGSLTSHSPGGD